MYLGSYQLGDRVGLVVDCHRPGAVAELPDAAPVATIVGPSGTAVRTLAVPPPEPISQPGLFTFGLHLDGRFAPGRYAVRFSYTVLGATRVPKLATFEVLPGGDPDGAALAMYHFQRPHAAFLVRQLDSGKIVKGRNPRV
jgi:hypothetical protein